MKDKRQDQPLHVDTLKTFPAQIRKYQLTETSFLLACSLMLMMMVELEM